jgi:hypothetical protein
MSGAKLDAETILQAMLPLAKRMLEAHGEFYPYGAAMNHAGEVVSIAGYDGNDQPPSREIVAMLMEALREAASKKEYRATGLFFDSRITVGSGQPTDAVSVALDHMDGYSVVVYIPYARDGGQVRYGEIIAGPGSHAIFA